MPEFRDITGQRFGRLVALEWFKKQDVDRVRIYWRCQCDCGNVRDINGDSLKRGATQSCGCYRAEVVKVCSITHGHAGKDRVSRIYICWRNMVRRCVNPEDSAWEYYGGRGITVCDRWLSFENFLADMGEMPDSLTLDRRDNEAGYDKANCYWATRKEQAQNRRPPRVNLVCRKGHSLSGKNLYTTSQGWRMCRACANEAQRRRRAKRR
jgi:hypothetical protein